MGGRVAGGGRLDERTPVINVVINGHPRQLTAPLTVSAYLASLGLDMRYVAVARNGDVVDASRFGDVLIADGDRLEVVRPVGGG